MDAPQTRVQEETPNEAGSLATELAHAYRQQAAFYRDQLHLSVDEADLATRGLDQTPERALEDLVRIRERAPDQVTWGDLQRLVDYDPDVLVAAWAQLKAEARQELATGHRTAQALEWNGRPLDRARFLAIRDSFRDSAPPRPGIESALVDTAAEAFGDYLEWSEHLHMQVSTEVTSERTSLERHGEWSPVRLSYAEAIEQSAKMADALTNASCRRSSCSTTCNGRRRRSALAAPLRSMSASNR